MFKNIFFRHMSKEKNMRKTCSITFSFGNNETLFNGKEKKNMSKKIYPRTPKHG